MAEREFQSLWGNGRAGRGDGDESVYGSTTCARSVSRPWESCGNLTGVAGDVGVEIKGMGIVDGACETSSGLSCRVLVRNFRIDRVDVHHVAVDTKTLSQCPLGVSDAQCF